MVTITTIFVAVFPPQICFFQFSSCVCLTSLGSNSAASSRTFARGSSKDTVLLKKSLCRPEWKITDIVVIECLSHFVSLRSVLFWKQPIYIAVKWIDKGLWGLPENGIPSYLSDPIAASRILKILCKLVCIVFNRSAKSGSNHQPEQGEEACARSSNYTNGSLETPFIFADESLPAVSDVNPKAGIRDAADCLPKRVAPGYRNFRRRFGTRTETVQWIWSQCPDPGWRRTGGSKTKSGAQHQPPGQGEVGTARPGELYWTRTLE